MRRDALRAVFSLCGLLGLKLRERRFFKIYKMTEMMIIELFVNKQTYVNKLWFIFQSYSYVRCTKL